MQCSIVDGLTADVSLRLNPILGTLHTPCGLALAPTGNGQVSTEHELLQVIHDVDLMKEEVAISASTWGTKVKSNIKGLDRTSARHLPCDFRPRFTKAARVQRWRSHPSITRHRAASAMCAVISGARRLERRAEERVHPRCANGCGRVGGHSSCL